MAKNTIVPLTILGMVPSYSSMGVPSATLSAIQIGSGTSAKKYSVIPGTPNSDNIYWAKIFDRKTLNPLVDVRFSTNDIVPADVAKYEKDNSVFLVLTTNGLKMDNTPTGAWAGFLYAQGASAQLTRLQQLATSWRAFGGQGIVGYIYVGTLGDTASDGIDSGCIGTEVHQLALSLQTLGTGVYTPTTLEVPS